MTDGVRPNAGKKQKHEDGKVQSLSVEFVSGWRQRGRVDMREHGPAQCHCHLRLSNE